MERYSRPPGTTGNISRSQAVRWYVRPNWYTGNQTSFVDVRPSYPKGSFITLPHGRVFRKPTSYQHTAYRTRVLNGHHGFTRSPWGPSDDREVYDMGRESGAISEKYRQSLFGGSFHPSTSSSGMDEAVTKALSELADVKAGIGEDLATFRQTLSLFVGKSSLLLEALRAVRNRKSWRKYLHKSARDLLRQDKVDLSAQLYIEYVYGLKPLVQDVYGVAELLKEQATYAMILQGHGRSSRTENRGAQSLWNTGYSYSRERRKSITDTAKFSCHLYARIDPSHQGLRSLNQLGLLNPVSLAWNLVPWSFVVDWFCPIGSVLEALTAPAGLIFIGGSKATRNRSLTSVEFQVSSTYYRPEYSNSTNYKTGLLEIEGEGYTRTALSGWPRPGFYFASDPFSGDRGLKALALGILQMKRWRDTVR